MYASKKSEGLKLISIVLPVYNESDSLESSVRKIQAFMRGTRLEYEIVIAEDGSTDDTDRIAAALASGDRKIRHIHFPSRLGRGRALKNAFRKCKGDVFVYFDIDISTKLDFLPKILEKIEDGSDVAIGSRLMQGSHVKRSVVREAASRGYNTLVWLLFGTRIKDMQCGFKAFRNSILPAILAAENDHWFWDTEVLLIAEVSGARIAEVPVTWRENNKSKVRLAKDAIDMGINLIKLRLRLKPVAIAGVTSRN